jgi:hypothetical protein
MRHIKTYKLFESSIQLTKVQMDWLNKCTRGTWTLNSDNKIDIKGDFSCSHQELTDFKGVEFGEITRNFNCSSNHLTSLKGCPQSVGRGFQCEYNRLTSLDGSPESVGGNFICRYNQLTSLEGAPQHVEGGFNCADNNLTSLEGCPQTVLRSFECYGNPVSANALIPIFYKMKALNIPYTQAVEVLWDSIPLDDQVLLYRPEFGWIDPTERRKFESISRINKIKNLI